MSASLTRTEGLRTTMRPVCHWPNFPNWFGFDPFQGLRASRNFEYDVTRTEDGYDVELPVPGYTRDQIEVTLKDGMVSVSGKNQRRSFARSLMVPDDVYIKPIDAKMQNELLRLCLRRKVNNLRSHAK
jgi:HSP20 family molecular chaperone IbpA